VLFLTQVVQCKHSKLRYKVKRLQGAVAVGVGEGVLKPTEGSGVEGLEIEVLNAQLGVLDFGEAVQLGSARLLDVFLQG
jgi:hypothetical protein